MKISSELLIVSIVAIISIAGLLAYFGMDTDSTTPEYTDSIAGGATKAIEKTYDVTMNREQSRVYFGGKRIELESIDRAGNIILDIEGVNKELKFNTTTSLRGMTIKNLGAKDAGINTYAHLSVKTALSLKCENFWDGGKNYFVNGFSYGPDENGNIISSTEICKSDNELIEVWCDRSGILKSEVASCQYGCEKGACLSKPKKDGPIQA